LTRTTAVFRRGLLSALAAVAAAAGPLPQLAHADTAPPPAEVTIPAGQKPGPVGWPVTVADATGYLVRSDLLGALGDHYSWYANDGSLTYDLGNVPIPGPQAVRLDDGSTLLWARTQGSTGVEVWDTAARAWTTYTLPADRRAVQVLPTASGWTIAATGPVPGATNPNPWQTLHLLDPAADGSFTDRPVSGWPAAGTTALGAWRTAPGAAVLQYKPADGKMAAGLLDVDTATLTVTGPEDNAPLINRDLFGWGVDGGVELRPRSDPQAAPHTLSLPGVAGRRTLVLTDSALLVETYSSDTAIGTVYSVPLDGGPATVLFAAGGTLSATADDGALVRGADDTGATVTWKVPAAGGAPTVLYRAPVYQPEHVGLSLARGAVIRAETAPYTWVNAYIGGAEVGDGTTPKLGGSISDAVVVDPALPRCDGGLRCLPLADGDQGGHHFPFYVQLTTSGDQIVGPQYSKVITGSHGGRIVSASGDLVVFDGSDGEQYVLDMVSSSPGVISERPATAAAVWGDTLWSATATPGVFTTAGVVAGSTPKTVATDAPCVPDELQALGRWLYWSCGADGPAGVWDSSSYRSVPVPAGHALLGDGYVLRHVGDQLVVTDVHTGTAAPDRVVASLPAGAYADDRDIVWTLDKYGDFLAYTDPQGTTHVLPSGVPHSPVGVLAGSVPPLATVSATGWRPQWTVSRAVASWRVDLRREGSTTVVASLSGGATSRTVSPTWNGRNAKGLLTPNGNYTWTLTLTPADGQGGTTSVTGSVQLFGGPQAARDYSGDDIGDLLAVTSSGGIDVRPGTGTGSVGAATLKATGWPAGSTVVPVDDLSGDKVNDLLVRDASGHLTRYDGILGSPPWPTLPHHLIGAGWNIYNLLTSPGDMSGDGYPDLVARDTKGNLYLYRGTASGVFAPRVNIGHGYQIYDMIVGVHNLWPGDSPTGNDDLVARDKAGVLWRYLSDGYGHLAARERIGGGWNVYNAIVGVGDINGDGRNDLVARDGNGDLWRYSGLGNGLFAPRVKIGWAWQTYKSLV
jgi:hypothetical protein